VNPGLIQGPPRVLIIVENLPVPLDRRVWQEARALSRAGWDVTVICPMRQAYGAAYEEIDRIKIHRHPLFEAKGALGFLLEYGTALFHELRLALKVFRQNGFDVVHACNPPDLIFLVALPFRLIGKKFVFDHHDLCPELFTAKFERRGVFYRMLRLCEWMTFKLANVVISANDTYRDIAIARGGKSPDDVVAVYSVPDRKWKTDIKHEREAHRRLVIGYVGIVAAQDGVDHLIRATRWILDSGRMNIQTVIVGDGPELRALQHLSVILGISDHVTFTGYQSGDALQELLSSFDIGVIPDPPNEYNDAISMNKVFEYSALGIPVAAFPLTETQRLLGDAAVYAEGNTTGALAAAIQRLISDEVLRKRTAKRSREIGRTFDWEKEAARLVAAYERLKPQPIRRPFFWRNREDKAALNRLK
jgi:glycosyltransferase involved in cell wall biosynthesis